MRRVLHILALVVCVIGTPTLTNAIEETLELITSFHHDGESAESSCCGGLAHRCGAEVVPAVLASDFVVELPSPVELSTPPAYAPAGGPGEPHVRDLMRPPNA